MQTIGITGGTGFIGQHLTALLVSKGYNVVIFTRQASKKTHDNITYAHWDVVRRTCDINPLKDLTAVVNLAGAGVADKRLTPKRKKVIIDSRVESTAFLLEKLREHSPNCKAIIGASATGFYGPDRDGKPFNETAPAYSDFLGSVCRQWENATLKASDFLRTVIIRIGIVLGKEGGAYPQLAGPLKFGIMPILGSGRQMVSWILVDDVARMFLYAIEHPEMTGVYNGVAPTALPHRELMRVIRKEKGGLGIPAPVPAFVLKIVLGEMSTEVLKSCTVSAQKTLDSGFTFEYPEISGAIRKIIGK